MFERTVLGDTKAQNPALRATARTSCTANVSPLSSSFPHVSPKPSASLTSLSPITPKGVGVGSHASDLRGLPSASILNDKTEGKANEAKRPKRERIPTPGPPLVVSRKRQESTTEHSTPPKRVRADTSPSPHHSRGEETEGVASRSRITGRVSTSALVQPTLTNWTTRKATVPKGPAPNLGRPSLGAEGAHVRHRGRGRALGVVVTSRTSGSPSPSPYPLSQAPIPRGRSTIGPKAAPGGTSVVDCVGNVPVWRALNAWFAAVREGRERGVGLIYGPPGVGKSSGIRKMAARHGFTAYVHNMSDRRTRGDVADIEAQIMASRSDLRPLIVLEEIDGVSGASAQALVQLFTNVAAANIEPTTTTFTDAQGVRSEKRRARCCPVMCIGNSFPRALRQVLRTHARVFLCQRLTDLDLRALAQRFCSANSIRFSAATLDKIVRDAYGDARKLLNSAKLICAPSTTLSDPSIPTPSSFSPTHTLCSVQSTVPSAASSSSSSGSNVSSSSSIQGSLGTISSSSSFVALPDELRTHQKLDLEDAYETVANTLALDVAAPLLGTDGLDMAVFQNIVLQRSALSHECFGATTGGGGGGRGSEDALGSLRQSAEALRLFALGQQLRNRTILLDADAVCDRLAETLCGWCPFALGAVGGGVSGVTHASISARQRRTRHAEDEAAIRAWQREHISLVGCSSTALRSSHSLVRLPHLSSSS